MIILDETLQTVVLASSLLIKEQNIQQNCPRLQSKYFIFFFTQISKVKLINNKSNVVSI